MEKGVPTYRRAVDYGIIIPKYINNNENGCDIYRYFDSIEIPEEDSIAGENDDDELPPLEPI